MVPRGEWPSYRCNELGGEGWLVQVVALRNRAREARIRFLDARTRDGRPFEEVDILSAVLKPVPDDLLGVGLY